MHQSAYFSSKHLFATNFLSIHSNITEENVEYSKDTPESVYYTAAELNESLIVGISSNCSSPQGPRDGAVSL